MTAGGGGYGSAATRVALPPPSVEPEAPVLQQVGPGVRLVRVFDRRDPHFSGVLAFRRWGPTARFDHHPGVSGTHPLEPTEHSVCGVWYCCPDDDFLTALIEVFFGDGFVDTQCRMAEVDVTEPITVLSIMGTDAMDAGTLSALSKAPYTTCWEWARYFYSHSDVYGVIDGVSYSGFHNDQRCLVLNERAERKLRALSDLPLRDARYVAAVNVARARISMAATTPAILP